jgi:aminopeptidase N
VHTTLTQRARNALLVLVGSLAGTVALDAQQTSGGAPIPEQDAYDVRHYDLRLKVDPARKWIGGSLTMRCDVAAGTARIALDLDEAFTVSGVRVAGRKAKFEHRDLRVFVDFVPPAKEGESLEVTVDYEGQPRVAPSPPWKGGFTWAETKSGAPWIATSCQGEGADLWWPCKDRPDDEPDGMDLWISVPEGLVCASNGVLRGTETADGWTTFHWETINPIANYGVALNIAPYEVIESTYTCVDGTELPVFFWVLPENRGRAEKALPEFLDHVRHMEEVCGPYPFRNEKYGIVETPHLGMEHQTIIAYGNRYRRTGFDYDWLHHHEMCHEWWANLVTNRNWKDMWIHEGIGTYMQALYIESRMGPEAYRTEMGIKRRSLVNKVAVAPRGGLDSQGIYFAGSGNDIYYKGSWICHSLRYLLGDETFFEVVRRWAYPDPAMEKVTDGSQCRFTDTDEIREIAEKISGRDLRWFFDVYVHQPQLPTLDLKTRDGVLHLEWKTPDDLPFPMPVPVRVGDEIVQVEMEGGKGQVDLAGQEHQVDPDRWLLQAIRRR